jgi:recombination protein RecA
MLARAAESDNIDLMVTTKKTGTSTTGLDKALAELNKAGDIQIGRGADTPALDIERLPTGIMRLDDATGGGIPRGRITELFGRPSGGKSTLALQITARAQKDGLNVAYLDMEQALDPSYMKALGVDWDSLILSQPDTAEQVFKVIDKLASTGDVALIVVDSVAAMSPRQESEGDYGDANVGSIARVMSQGLRKVNPLLAPNNTAILFINQLRANIGAYSPQGAPPDITTGGRSLPFYASLRMEVNRTGPVKAGENIIGATTKVKVVKNKTAAPYKEATFDIIYGKGVSRGSSIIDVAVDLGLIKRNGGWFADADGVSLGQGKPAVIDLLDTDDELYNRILSEMEGK